MKAKNGELEILAIGLDSFSIEAIKKSLKENRVKFRISFLQDISDIQTYNKKTAEAVFFFSNRQTDKTIDDVRRISAEVPGAAITLLSPRPDHHGIVAAFRAGLFDFLTLPI